MKMRTRGMIFIIGDDSWGAQRGRRSEMWLELTCGKFVTQRLLLLSSPLLPTLASPLLSSYQPILTHLSWPAQHAKLLAIGVHIFLMYKPLSWCLESKIYSAKSQAHTPLLSSAAQLISTYLDSSQLASQLNSAPCKWNQISWKLKSSSVCWPPYLVKSHRSSSWWDQLLKLEPGWLQFIAWSKSPVYGN